jgi:hypothetical protein
MSSSRKKVVWLCIVAAVIIAGGFWLYREIQIDKCLDGGGAWDYDVGTCKTGESESK